MLKNEFILAAKDKLASFYGVAAGEIFLRSEVVFSQDEFNSASCPVYRWHFFFSGVGSGLAWDHKIVGRVLKAAFNGGADDWSPAGYDATTARFWNAGTQTLKDRAKAYLIGENIGVNTIQESMPGKAWKCNVDMAYQTYLLFLEQSVPPDAAKYIENEDIYVVYNVGGDSFTWKVLKNQA